MFVMANPVVGSVLTGEVLVFRGASDASAAVAVGENMFVVADDENNILRIYETGKAGQPVGSFDMTSFLGIEPDHPESDIEDATIVGRRIYWITSHGRNKDGKMRPNRYRFFATDVFIENRSVKLRPAGKPYKTLVHELLKTQAARRLGLDKATRFGAELKKKDMEKLAPKDEGLNIEGLCASADGGTLYFGLRNPRPKGKQDGLAKAIVVPLCNPDRIIEKGEAPVFGEPMLWDLKGLGIRGMEYSPFHKTCFVIAGGPDEDEGFALYRWSGKPESPPELVRELSLGKSKFSPEALIPFEKSGRLLMLSDDGSLVVKVAGAWECLEGEYRKNGTTLNKYLANPGRKTFHGIWLELEDK
ncbi:MAG: hypothetical protein A2Z38_04135 [Planctomycetes bacterium RBG_19FT_COMBO_48_8]|nr:MAG: hypothetical protein A2Z38_04135 [Planctomycetes bacterium RBG_19FT_COMBO_48_8]